MQQIIRIITIISVIYMYICICVVFDACLPMSNSCKVIYDVPILWSLEWFYNFDYANALFDATNVYASSLQGVDGVINLINYYKLLACFSRILVCKYVIIDNYKAFGDTLRIEM